MPADCGGGLVRAELDQPVERELEVAAEPGDVAMTLEQFETALRAAQSEIESATGRHYVPVYKTLSHWAQPWQTAIPLHFSIALSQPPSTE